MPTYGYQCSTCGHTFEVFQKMTDDPVGECEKCRGKVRRLLYPVGIVFKGSGFHINDYRKPEKKSDSESGAAPSQSKTPEKPVSTSEASD